MKCLVYDGTWYGLLSSVFYYYEYRLSDVQIISTANYQPVILSELIDIHTDFIHAERVIKGIKKRTSADACRQLLSSFLSEQKNIENIILEYIKLVFSSLESPEKAFGNAHVLKISQTAKMVHREKHRMEAFTRFQLTADGLYYAHIEPDFNVIPLIIRHFKNRYADQKWLIYDLKRKYGIYYDLNEVTEIIFELSEPSGEQSVFHSNEVLYQTLWKDYFKSVNIKARKNLKLHIKHVPKRYWKYLIEKIPG